MHIAPSIFLSGLLQLLAVTVNVSGMDCTYSRQLPVVLAACASSHVQGVWNRFICSRQLPARLAAAGSSQTGKPGTC